MIRQRRATLFFAILSFVSCDFSPIRAHADDQPSRKKLIEWGWDEPDTKFIREHIKQMEEMPFDGLVFHANSDKGGNFTWQMWGERPFGLDEFQHAIDDLKATEFRQFSDRFLRVNVTPGNVDWFDEVRWNNVLQNFGVAAQIAKRGGCKGFMFDVEQYEGPLFDYNRQPLRDKKSFADYQNQVFQCGQQWMKEVNRHFPDATILLTFGYSITRPPAGSTDRSDSPYGLMADFLDGLLNACSKETTIVDACENAYPYKQRSQFDDAYDTIKNKSQAWTANPDKYRDQVKAGFGIWMDYDWRKNAWDVNDFSKNYYSPVRFGAAVRAALEVSDGYVWIYTEQPRWWTNEKLPPEYVEALRNAR